MCKFIHLNDYDDVDDDETIANTAWMSHVKYIIDQIDMFNCVFVASHHFFSIYIDCSIKSIYFNIINQVIVDNCQLTLLVFVFWLFSYILFRL